MAPSQIFTSILASEFADVHFARDDTTQRQRDVRATLPSGVYFRSIISAPCSRKGHADRTLEDRWAQSAKLPARPASHTEHSAPRPSKRPRPACHTAAAASPDAADWCNGQQQRPQNARYWSSGQRCTGISCVTSRSHGCCSHADTTTPGQLRYQCPERAVWRPGWQMGDTVGSRLIRRLQSKSRVVDEAGRTTDRLGASRVYDHLDRSPAPLVMSELSIVCSNLVEAEMPNADRKVAAGWGGIRQ